MKTKIMTWPCNMNNSKNYVINFREPHHTINIKNYVCVKIANFYAKSLGVVLLIFALLSSYTHSTYLLPTHLSSTYFLPRPTYLQNLVPRHISGISPISTKSTGYIQLCNLYVCTLCLQCCTL